MAYVKHMLLGRTCPARKKWEDLRQRPHAKFRKQREIEWATRPIHAPPFQFSASRRVVSKDKVGRFGLLVTGEAGFHESRVGRFAVLEVTEPPASGCGVLG